MKGYDVHVDRPAENLRAAMELLEPLLAGCSLVDTRAVIGRTDSEGPLLGLAWVALLTIGLQAQRESTPVPVIERRIRGLLALWEADAGGTLRFEMTHLQAARALLSSIAEAARTGQGAELPESHSEASVGGLLAIAVAAIVVSACDRKRSAQSEAAELVRTCCRS